MKIEMYKEAEINAKRFYPPFKAISNCPHCGKECTFDGEDDYISEPQLSKPESIYFYCEDCDENFEKKVILTMNVEEAKDEDIK